MGWPGGSGAAREGVGVVGLKGPEIANSPTQLGAVGICRRRRRPDGPQALGGTDRERSRSCMNATWRALAVRGLNSGVRAAHRNFRGMGSHVSLACGLRGHIVGMDWSSPPRRDVLCLSLSPPRMFLSTVLPRGHHVRGGIASSGMCEALARPGVLPCLRRERPALLLRQPVPPAAVGSPRARSPRAVGSRDARAAGVASGASCGPALLSVDRGGRENGRDVQMGRQRFGRHRCAAPRRQPMPVAPTVVQIRTLAGRLWPNFGLDHPLLRARLWPIWGSISINVARFR